GQPPKLFLHLIGGLPCTRYHFANATHGLTVRPHDRECAQIMQDVFGRYCFLADAALGEGDILRNTTVEVMSDHDHIERLIGRIHCVRTRRSCRSWKDICLTAHLDDVRGMPATGSFRVKRVDCSALESCDSAFDETALVQCVGMNSNLNIHVI